MYIVADDVFPRNDGSVLFHQHSYSIAAVLCFLFIVLS